MREAPVRMAIARYPHTRNLVGGATVTPSGVTIEPELVEPIVSVYRRQIRDLEFDLCEMPICTYLIAREHGLPLVALPVFLNRRFHHGDLICREGSGIGRPADLAGKRVGVRAYSVTSGVWVRGLLQEIYGVGPGSIRWFTDDEEHVTSLRLPPNVEHAGKPLAELFRAGELDAAMGGWAGIGRTGAPGQSWRSGGAEDATAGAYPLFPQAEALEREWFAGTGIYPIHGLLVLTRSIIERLPQLPGELWNLFTEAKENAASEDSAETERYRRLAAIVGGDPLPYGLAANTASVEAAIRFCRQQGLLERPVSAADVFHPL